LVIRRFDEFDQPPLLQDEELNRPIARTR
jgi:hypothetical protein